jgi:hypothetical protein
MSGDLYHLPERDMQPDEPREHDKCDHCGQEFHVDDLTWHRLSYYCDFCLDMVKAEYEAEAKRDETYHLII